MTLPQIEIESLIVSLLKDLNYIFLETTAQDRGSIVKVLYSTLKRPNFAS